MALGLLVCFLSMSAGTMIGFYLYKREAVREQYFDSIIKLCNSLVADIRFCQHTLAVLVEKHLLERDTPLGENLDQYLDYITKGDSQLCLSRGCLKPSEFEDVKSFFRVLGTSDSQTQVFEIENYRDKFICYKEEQSKIVDKRAKNYVKLGFLFGLALGILML